MKKRIFSIVVLFVITISLSGCFGRAEITLQSGFKEENKVEFEAFKESAIEEGQGLVKDIYILDNEVIITSQHAIYDEVVANEELKSNFIKNMDERKEEIAENIIAEGLIEDLEVLAKGYEGKTVITYIYKALDGTEFYKYSFNEDGLVE